MPARKLDLFAQARRQAERAIVLLNQEIRRTEAELKDLLSKASAWRAAISGTGASKTRTARRGKVAARAGARKAAKRGGAKRVDWDSVLASVPSTFGVEDVIKHPAARAKGRPQIYPALSRWLEAKRIKRVDKGKYQKI